ncbi:MAG: hypothetical protein ACHRXM_10395 [Isosphaerales bacterium]
MSRLPSSRGSSAPASAPARRPGVLVQAPKSDIYVVLLGIALAAIIVSCLLIVRLFSNYGFSTKVSARSAPSQVGSMV